MKIRLITCVLGALVLGAVNSRAQTGVWTGGGGANQDWSDASNWNAGAPPNNGTDVITFNSATAFTSVVDVNWSINSLTVTGTAGALNLNNSGGKTLTIGSGGFTDSSSNAVNVGVPLLGAMTLTQNGTGALTITLTGSTYTGNTSVTSGSLSDSVAGAFSASSMLNVGNTGVVHVNHDETVIGLNDAGAGNGSVVLASGATLLMDGGFTTTFSGVISGNGQIEKNGDSTLELTGANTYTGATLIDTGSAISVGSGGTTGSLVSSVSSTGTGSLEFDRSNAYTYAGALSGSLNVSTDGSGVTTLSGVNTYSGTTTVSIGTLQAGSTSAFGGATGLGFVTVNSTGTLALNGNSNTIGWLSGSGIVSLGSATLTIAYPTSSTTFSGLITGAGGSLVSDGQTLELSGGNTYSGTTTINSGSTLIADNSTGSATGTGPVVIASGGTLQVGPGGEVALGIVTNSSISNSGTLSFANSSNQTYGGNISGAGVLNQFGNGTLTLSGNNSFSGFTQVEFGVLAAGSTTAFGGAGNSNFTLESGAVLDLSIFSNSIGSIQGDSSTLIDIGSGAVLTIAGNNQTSPFMGTIQGGGSLNLTGVNAVTTLSGANAYTGGTTIASGFLVADNPSGSATGTGNITIDPVAILQIGNSDTSGSVAAPNIINNGTIELARTDSTTLASNISGSGGISMLESGTFTLTGNNTYSGMTTILQGTLQAGSTSAFGGATGLSNISFTLNGTLDLGTFSNTVGSISGGALGSTIDLGSPTTVLTIAHNTGFTPPYAGIITGSGSIVLTTPGAFLILSGANTYSGGTNLVDGTLIVDNSSGSATGTGPVHLTAGTTLQIGNGDTAGAVNGTPNISSSGNIIFDRTDSTTFTPNISGSGSVTMNGSGAVTLSGVNTYTGNTVITSGELVAGSTSAFGTTSGGSFAVITNGNLVLEPGFDNSLGGISGFGSGQIQLIGASLTINGTGGGDFGGVITGTGGLILSGSGIQTLAGSNNFTGAITINSGTLSIGDGSTPGASITSNVVNGGTLIFEPASSDNLTYPGNISGNGSVNFTGTGTITLSGASDYSGPTTVASGTLADGAPNAFSPTSSMQVAATGRLSVNYDDTVGDLTNDPGLGGGPVVIAAGKTLSSNGVFYLNSSNDYLGTISGGGSFSIANGVQGLAGNNTYSGGTSVSAGGELFVGSNTAVGTGTLTFYPGTEMSPDANVSLANPIVLSGGAILDNDDGGANNLTLTGLISEAGEAGSIEWCTTGVLALINANTFTGGVDMREGTLLLGSDTAAGSGAITLDTGTILSAYGTGVTRNISNAIDVTGSTQLGDNDDNNLILSGSITGNFPILYMGGPTGTLKLTGASTTDGGFTLDSGTVIAGNNNAFGSDPNQIFLNGGVTLNVVSGITVNNHLNFSGSANVLSGNGTFDSFVTVDSTVILSPSASPGNGPGILSFATGLNLTTGGTISFHIYDAAGAAGTGYSEIFSNSGVLLTANPGTLTFNLVSINGSGNAAPAINFNPASSYSWTFLETTGMSGFTANQFNLNASGFLNGTGGGTFSFSQVGENLDLNFTPVPEPSTWAMLGLGVLAIVPLALRRRRISNA